MTNVGQGRVGQGRVLQGRGQTGMAMREAADRMPVGALVAAEDRLEQVRAMLTEAMTVRGPGLPPRKVARSAR